jgi:hypothetical protein
MAGESKMADIFYFVQNQSILLAIFVFMSSHLSISEKFAGGVEKGFFLNNYHFGFLTKEKKELIPYAAEIP